jgi:hypothetical protein
VSLSTEQDYSLNIHKKIVWHNHIEELPAQHQS